MAEIQITDPKRVEAIQRVLQDEGEHRFGYRPLQGEFDAEGSNGEMGKAKRTAYEIPIPWGRLKELINGMGGDMEPLITTQWPSGELDLVASSRVLKYINQRVKAYRSRFGDI